MTHSNVGLEHFFLDTANLIVGQLIGGLRLGKQALKNLLKRVPNMDLQFFVIAVCIQRQCGGDLAEILNKIGDLVREADYWAGQASRELVTAEDVVRAMEEQDFRRNRLQLQFYP